MNRVHSIDVNNVNRPLNESDFNCVVCLELLRNPVSLECGHTMCLECADKVSPRKCPTCRAEFFEVNKSIMMDMMMKTLFGKRYTKRCKEYETVRKYYKSARYDTLWDIIIDTVTDNSKENFCKKEKVEEIVSNLDVDGLKYTLDEVRLTIEKMKEEREILHVRKYLLLGDDGWIYQNIAKFDDKIHSGVILEALSFIYEYFDDDEYNADFTAKIKRRRSKNIKDEYDVHELEQKVIDLINNKIIPLD